MISLFENLKNIMSLDDWILESLVNFKELREDMKFVEITKDEAEEFIMGDDFNNGKDLDVANHKEFNEMIFCTSPSSEFYKIMYKDKLFGIFAYRNLNKPATNKDRLEPYHYPFIKSLINIINTANEEEINIDNTTWIVLLQFSKKLKTELDINPLAGIKVFYEKMTEKLKQEGIKTILAFGKDANRAEQYIKAGKFKRITNDKDDLIERCRKAGHFAGLARNIANMLGDNLYNGVYKFI